MAVQKFIQSNFTTGEISSKMEGRVDFQRYYNAVKTLRNWLPMVQGGVTRRPGMRFVDYAKYPDKKCRLIPFEYAATASYVIEVGNLYMRIIKDGYLVRAVSGSDLILNGDFAADIGDWTDYSEAPGAAAWDGVGAASLDGGATGVGSIGQAITTVDGKTYNLVFDVADGDVYVRIGTTAEGTEIVNDAKATAGTSRSVTFIARGITTYIQFLRKSTGAITIDNVVCKLYDPVEIVSPYTEDDLIDLKWAQDSNDLYIVNGTYWPRKLSRTSDTSWTLTTVDNLLFEDGPYFAETNILTLTPSWIGPSVEKVVNGEFNTDTIWTKGANWGIGGGVAYKAAGGLNNLSQDISEAASEVYLVIYTIVAIAGGSLTVSVGGVAGTARAVPGTYTEIITATGADSLTFVPSDAAVVCSIDNVSVMRLSILTASGALWNTDSPSKHLGAFWRVKQGTLADPTTWKWGYGRIIEVTDSTHVKVLVKTAFLNTTASLGHREGRWSELNLFPKSVTFYQNRLLWGGSPSSHQTFWGSCTEDPLNNMPGANDADALSFTIGSTKVNMIQWIVSARGIILGTNGGIFRAVGAPITPNSIDVNPECPEGASYNMALVINPIVIFVNRTGKQVIGIVYSYESDSYEAEDLSLLCDHLVDAGVGEMVFQSGVNPVVWMFDNNGVILAMTFNRPQKVIAWSHHITSGIVESLAVIPNADEGYNEVYAIVQRELNEETVRTIEVLDPVMNTDCGLATDFGSEVSHVSGLEHLIGEMVQIVGDDAVYPEQAVDENGQIEMDPPAQSIEIGLGYSSYLETLKPEIKSDQETIQASFVRWSQIYARLFDTVGLKINGEVIPFRKASDPMDQGITPFTGDKKIVNLGWEDHGVITIEQDLPLSATVLCLFGNLEVN